MHVPRVRTGLPRSVKVNDEEAHAWRDPLSRGSSGNGQRGGRVQPKHQRRKAPWHRKHAT